MRVDLLGCLARSNVVSGIEETRVLHDLVAIPHGRHVGDNNTIDLQAEEANTFT
jgi:hypothetical protein